MSRASAQVSTSVRPKRTPINGRNILSVTGKDPDYVYRIVNDVGDRPQQFLEAGYEFVDAKDVKIGDRRIESTTPEGSKAQVSVGIGQKAYVMRIRKEWYDEDQLAKQTRVNQLEDTIKNPTGKADYGKVEIKRGE